MKNNKLVKRRLIIFDGDLIAAVNCKYGRNSETYLMVYMILRYEPSEAVL